jgi:hypothetical protein
MKIRVITWIAAWLVAIASTTSPAAAADAPFTGTWSGSFEIHFADGRISNETAWLVLEQSGKSVNGTAGPKADQQSPIRGGVASRNQLAFDVDSTQGKMLKVTLKRDGDRLKGEAAGEIGEDKVRAVLDLAPVSGATAAGHDPLYQKMLALDTEMFDSFNRCADPAQLAKHAAFFDKDVEFYHDLGGVEWGAAAVTDSTRKNVCGKFRRELDPASFRVYPIPGFGAMTLGTHRFCHTPTTCEGIGEFTLVWKQTGDEWKVTRALSYAHRSLGSDVRASPAP